MARYTGPRSKISRRFGEPIYGPDKNLERLARGKNPPGQHGANRRRKLSEYGVQLREKQKAKYIYGMLEKQFRIFFERAKAKQGKTGDILLQLCETRLDNIVYRLGLAPTRAAARQLVSHRHITVDGKVCNIASYIVKPGQTISVREKDRTMSVVIESLKNPRTAAASWLQWDEGTMSGSLLSVPERAEIPENIDVQLIVELYSR